MRAVSILALGLIACGPSGPKIANVPDGGMIDPAVDNDGDGYTQNQGDCDDRQRSVYPGAAEICDGRDNDCDNDTDGPCDNDGDGFTKRGGDCNDGDSLISPGALEVVDNKVDDDCDSKTDEPIEPCVGTGGTDALSFAAAMGLCAPWLVAGADKTYFHGTPDPASYAIRPGFGKYKPREGDSFVVLSTGIAASKNDKEWVQPQPGTTFNNEQPNPLPMMQKNACYDGPDALNVKDYVELKLTLRVPTNAKSFSFNFNFMSSEYPEFVGTQYNDKFLVILDSKSYKGNVSFDKNNRPININAAFFDVCDTEDICNGMQQNVCTKPASDLDGTGFDIDDGMGNGRRIGGGTGWLTTTAPITPGETATLRFIIFDTADRLFDSTVVIDNFIWQLNPASKPETVG